LWALVACSAEEPDNFFDDGGDLEHVDEAVQSISVRCSPADVSFGAPSDAACPASSGARHVCFSGWTGLDA
jgi:hypothetical protein